VARKPTDIVKLQLRLPEALRRRLERAAKAHDRSMNTEIVLRLEEAFQMDELNAQMKASMGRGFKEALMVPLWEIGRFTQQERMARFFKELLGIDPDEPDRASDDKTAA
jgi:hypothetical protein